jgi:hypothetical protein
MQFLRGLTRRRWDISPLADTNAPGEDERKGFEVRETVWD